VGVKVDKSRRDDTIGRVDRFGRLTIYPSYGNHPAIGDSDICPHRLGSGSVNQAAVYNYDIKHI
jgi:hypothetical protein